MRRSDQPGAGKRANSNRGLSMQRLPKPKRRDLHTLGQNMFAAIMDEANFSEGFRPGEVEPGMAVRLRKESSERLATGELLAGQAAKSYGTVVRSFMKHRDEGARRAGHTGTKKVVVRLVSGEEVVTDPWNLERVTTLDLLAAASDGE